MGEQSIESVGDFVRVASCATPTEAHLLKGVLESAGLAPQVADANIVQANTWMTQAVGGVRVLVPASQVEAARQAMAEFDAGAFVLPGEEMLRVSYADQPAPLFSPDRAVVLSLLLTPAFGAAVHLANGGILRQGEGRAGQWLWLLLMTSFSLGGILFLHQLSPGPLVTFRASVLMMFVTAVWYFLAGREQSKRILESYGVRFRKRSLVVPSLICAAGLLVLGWVLDQFVPT